MNPEGLGGIAERIAEIRDRIARAALRAGRSPAAVTLVGASKTKPAAVLREALAAGLHVFGENRVQEAEPKIAALPGARWHFIGRLQRNKARRAAELFELIHSLDSLRLAETLDLLGRERGRPVPVLVEVNVAGEASKGGFAPAEFPAVLRRLAALSGLQVRGLMTIPPPVGDPEGARPYFQTVARFAREQGPEAGLDLAELSMGMSDDFEVAVEEGATLVRVGTALFGSRAFPE